MFCKAVLNEIDIIYKSENYSDLIEIRHLSDDTHDVTSDTCFVCTIGNKFDSHDLIHTLTVKPALIVAQKQLDTDIPYVIVPDSAVALPKICFNYYENPSQKLNLIGVTGTDGKTTTALVIKQLIDRFADCAYIGTNGFMYQSHNDKNGLTTPKPIALNRFLKQITGENIKYASLEVSSQGLDLHRADYLHFKAAVFTNLTHEHLDYHKNMENYFQSKLKLFKMLDEDAFAVVNSDCKPYAKRIREVTKAKVITYGTDPESDYAIVNIVTAFKETRFDLIVKDKIFKNVKLNLFGDYNVYNAAAAVATASALGFKIEEIIPLLGNLREIDGRMHIIESGQPFNVVVDFAHTPYALECLLRNLKNFTPNNLTIVFGAAGERDSSKRPFMGEVAEKYAKTIILTNEDPKTEEPFKIIGDIFRGIKNPYKVEIIPDRRQAIIKALDSANKEDLVVITGKGNEQFQMFNGYTVEHNDIGIAEHYLQSKYRQSVHSIAGM